MGIFHPSAVGRAAGAGGVRADRASQCIQANILRRTLLCDLFVCILWLHAVWHFASTVFARPKAVTAAARSVAAGTTAAAERVSTWVGGNNVLGPTAAAQASSGILPMACSLDCQDPVPLPPRLSSSQQLHSPQQIMVLQVQHGLCAASSASCSRLGLC